MTDKDKEPFTAGLRNGLGLTRTAAIINSSPQAVSAYIKANKEFRRECEEAITYAGKALIMLSNDYLKERKLASWQNNNMFIRAFVNRLTLWESFCTAGAVTPGKVIEAYMLLLDWDEVATAIGFTRVQLNSYLLLNPLIGSYVKENPDMFLITKL